jgi:CTP synthase
MDATTPHPVIDLMEAQKSITNMGGTMRLGAWECALKEDSMVRDVYKSETILERHRHRSEYNDSYRKQLEEAGMKITGTNPDTGLVEIIELSNHPWFVGVQYHPEYKSTVANPHPLFVAFVAAAVQRAAK